MLIDRFSDGKARQIESISPHSPKQCFKNICGGNLKGITQNLNYLKDLGATAIWISPFYENNSNSYHGYAIQDFLNVDSRFGTLEELKNLVTEAHKLDIRVIFDVVINHTGDNWYYQNEQYPAYSRGRIYQEGGWRYPDKPIPVELRNFNYYRKQGQINRWDSYPETQQGDFFSLKKLKLDESKSGLEVLDLIVKIYSYWIKETDCDGFRLDTVKHAGRMPVAMFCDGIRKYCAEIGKANFFIIGEIPLQYEGIKPFLESVQSTISGASYSALDTAFDFPLHFVLADIVKGRKPFSLLKESFQERESIASETPMVTFLDNHDRSLEFASDTNRVIQYYLTNFEQESNSVYVRSGHDNKQVWIKEAYIELLGKKVSSIMSGSDIDFVIKYESAENDRSFSYLPIRKALSFHFP